MPRCTSDAECEVSDICAVLNVVFSEDALLVVAPPLDVVGALPPPLDDVGELPPPLDVVDADCPPAETPLA
jgi:hypothetical protein